jgi:molybdopterin-guanine dinucleotide biosynthesis adapter protein
VNVLGFAGFSGSGKTTLLEKLITSLVDRGVSLSLVKHAHHSFDVDTPGKDSYRHRVAGCTEVLVTSKRRWALVHELRDEAEPDLFQQIERLAPCDLVLVEGFKQAPIAKIEVRRAALGSPLLHPGDANVIALASDERLDTALPQFHIDDAGAIAAFVIDYFGLTVPLSGLVASRA